MVFNSTGIDNTGVGYFTLYNNDTGNSNSALGSDTLISNISGDCNVAVGESALLANTTGDNNIAVGCDAGSSITTGSNNIYIGNLGEDDESNTTASLTSQCLLWDRSCGGCIATSIDVRLQFATVRPDGF